ncbi:MAG: LysM peptidoglycan-binding domain-containing protein [Phycisphaerae bacterium]|nr:LysM peptidoglycan-binding domain-containing protein [Phycisphaerae bacterium]
MTRDVKIGLLLGLAFIFMIAFVINGLPSFRGDTNELTKSMVRPHNKQPGIGANERDVIKWTGSIEKEPFRVEYPLPDEPNIRYITELPQGPVLVKGNNASSLNNSDTVKMVTPKRIENERTDVRKTETVKPKPSLPKIYEVTDGDNLALIAKKYYGDVEGNKRANIMRIFEANRNLLKAADEIQVGQKLIIPPLRDLASSKEENKDGLASSIFEKVKSIGREHLSLKKPDPPKQGKSYTVRDGDSLWKIAADQLGDGSRYTEVAKLNEDVLSDEDSLTVGMTLKMPAQ